MQRLFHIFPVTLGGIAFILPDKIWFRFFIILLFLPLLLTFLNFTLKLQWIRHTVKWWVRIACILFFPFIIIDLFFYLTRPYHSPPVSSKVEDIDEFWNDFQSPDGYKKHLGKFVRLRCERSLIPDFGFFDRRMNCTLVRFKNKTSPEKKSDLIFGTPISVITLDENNLQKRPPLGMPYGFTYVEHGYLINICELTGYFTDSGYFAVPYASIFPKNGGFHPFKYSVFVSTILQAH